MTRYIGLSEAFNVFGPGFDRAIMTVSDRLRGGIGDLSLRRHKADVPVSPNCPPSW